MKEDSEAQGKEGQLAGATLLKGAAVLGVAAVISKLIGTIQKIPLQNVAGDEVFGIYNAVYPLYILILFLATAGFPIVVSKFVSEHVSAGRHEEAHRVLRVSSAVLAATGFLFFLFLFCGADWLAGLMGASQTSRAIRSVSFALLLVPVMSALRGYFQGYQNMIPTAVSQVVEQTIRVATMFGLLLLFVHYGYGADWIAAGATFGSVMGAVAGLLVMLHYYLKGRRKGKDSSLLKTAAFAPAKSGEVCYARESNSSLIRRLLLYALPICLGTIALPILTLVDSFSVPRLLKHHGLDEMGALYQFGLYNHGLPLVQLVAMLASSMSAALVPAIAQAKAKGDSALLRSRTEQSLRLTWLIGLAASVGLAVLAEPINVMFFRSGEGSLAMVILSFTALFSILNIVASSVLQGFGAVAAPAFYLLAAAAAKIAANAALVPRWGIDGAATAAVVAYALAGGLALAHALRATGVTPAFGQTVIKPMLSLGLMTVGLLAVTRGLPALLGALHVGLPLRGMATVVSLAGVAVGALVYALALLRLGVVSSAELEQVPQLRGKPLALLRRTKLLR
ncbi:putative polysaccharide biosynthesis protein [Paenibacillus radicis (ex Xue et al. 2023)]|uniref:Oligosaccharide flippase family protein n=1 Tax=Paenibacillus radicis (ex Xue et al. 2023) TaxID=2972489 RepID=A0ABT1YSG2_9BACL|nr:oligosaccharide flippase family protein [Paenibacillus radicis (ex Xue et al. 2023)]MCR8636111.1 oligosaccharide flippase family protein [Paenibacillus radicis (ex Xue et al. 2023)]